MEPNLTVRHHIQVCSGARNAFSACVIKAWEPAQDAGQSAEISGAACGGP